MKKIQIQFIAVALLLFSINFSFAQISIGAKAGVYTSFLSTTDAVDNVTPDIESVTSPTFGLVSEIAIGENFAFQPELLYTTKGFKMTESMNINLGGLPIPAGVTARTKINYLELPLLAKYKFGENNLKFNIMAGPVLGYAINGHLKSDANLIIDINTVKNKIDLDALNYERFEVNAAVGAGVTYEMEGGKLFADVRYVQGFTDLYKAPVVDLNLRNRGVGVTVGYMVNF
jgi:uncharacterized protein YunC (DUF1805 family)